MDGIVYGRTDTAMRVVLPHARRQQRPVLLATFARCVEGQLPDLKQ